MCHDFYPCWDAPGPQTHLGFLSGPSQVQFWLWPTTAALPQGCRPPLATQPVSPPPTSLVISAPTAFSPECFLHLVPGSCHSALPRVLTGPPHHRACASSVQQQRLRRAMLSQDGAEELTDHTDPQDGAPARLELAPSFCDPSSPTSPSCFPRKVLPAGFGDSSGFPTLYSPTLGAWVLPSHGM